MINPTKFKCLTDLLAVDKTEMIDKIKAKYNITGTGNCERQKVSNAFEMLVSKWFSEVWQVPFEDSKVNLEPFRVKWFGDETTLTASSSGRADSIAYLYGYQLVIECTLVTNAHQSSKEFAPATRHFDDLVKNKQIDSNNSFIVMVSPELHEDTFNHFKNDRSHNCALWSTKHIQFISENIEKLFKFRVPQTHFHLQELLIMSARLLIKSTSLDEYNMEIEKFVHDWYNDILKNGFLGMLAISSYKVLVKNRDSGHRLVAATEILSALEGSNEIQEYSKSISKSILLDDIWKAITSYRIAKVEQVTYEMEPFFKPLDINDVQLEYWSFLQAIRTQ